MPAYSNDFFEIGKVSVVYLLTFAKRPVALEKLKGAYNAGIFKQFLEIGKVSVVCPVTFSERRVAVKSLGWRYGAGIHDSFLEISEFRSDDLLC